MSILRCAVFESGPSWLSTDASATKSRVPAGARVIDFKGGKRSIRTIEFWYGAKGFLTGKADATVFGMH